MLQQFKSLMLPLAMLAGFIFSDFFTNFTYLTPYLIFVMLFITFCRITPRQMHFSGLHFFLLAFQFLVSLIIYLLTRPFNEFLAQGMLICILAPTATSAVVIAGMLGANIATMASFTLLSNVMVAFTAPVIFSFVGNLAQIPFMESFSAILVKILPILVLPFIAAFLLLKLAPRFHEKIKNIQILSFYLWSLALMIVTGQTVKFIKDQPTGDYSLEIMIAFCSFVLCICQFITGRLIGSRYGDKIAGGQSLGQKNTILAIWMAQTYLSPLASIAPASYVLWQNIVNSWQLWRERNSCRSN